MTEEARKALVTKLAKPARFDSNYPAGSRTWFVDRLARVYDAKGMSDAEIEASVTDVLTKSKPLVRAKRSFNVGLPFGKAVATLNLGRYVEILYGAIAWHPEFVLPANSAMLDFIARRRMRSVSRMNFWVNPNYQGYFRYPSTCPSNERWRVNVDAQAHWEAPGSAYIPIVLKRPVTPDLETAIRKIWTAKSKACDGNLLDCATTTTTVLMDSLFVAKERGKLLSKIDSKNNSNLAINHVNAAANACFVTDNSAEGLFTKDERLAGDLEVGDHAYIYNHPLYKVFKPTGSWRGEHSLVFNGGNRTIKSKRGILFGGHGKIGTVYDFYDAFLVELQTDLHRAYRIGAIFLHWLDSGKTAFPGQVTTTSETLGTGSSSVAYELSVFTVSYRFNNYMKPATASGLAQTSETGFVVAYFPAQNQFTISRKKNRSDAIADGVKEKSVPLQRDASPSGSEFDPINWKILYTDPSTATEKRYALYQKVGGRLTFKPLTIDELFDSPFLKRNPAHNEIATTTPRVDLGSTYQSFLTANGGI